VILVLCVSLTLAVGWDEVVDSRIATVVPVMIGVVVALGLLILVSG
jgi:hypothetical protein